MKQPLIIIGMHFGGSSLVSEILHQAGIFMGNDRNEKFHSRHFHNINNWIFSQVNATWDNPYNFRFIDQDFTDRVVKALKRQLKGRSLRAYLDPPRLRYRKYDRFDFDWGWSDPLNTFTIQLWKHLFDDAHIIHVHRNPVDVAAALQNQNRQFRHSAESGILSRLQRHNMERKLSHEKVYELSLRTNSIEQGFEVWKQYIVEAIRAEQHTGFHVYHVAYEDLLQNFHHETERLFNHLGFRIPDGALKKTEEKIRDYKAYQFLKNDELADFYQIIKNQSLVTEMDYHEIR